MHTHTHTHAHAHAHARAVWAPRKNPVQSCAWTFYSMISTAYRKSILCMILCMSFLSCASTCASEKIKSESTTYAHQPAARRITLRFSHNSDMIGAESFFYEQHKMGRPTKFTKAIADEIVERIAQGTPLREICRDDHMPGWVSVYSWIDKDPEFSERIARARILGFSAIAEEALEIIDTEPEVAESWSQTGGSKHRDSAHVAWLKNRAEMRLKLLAKWDPKRFGDKLAIGGADDLPPLSGMSENQLDERIAMLMAGKTNDSKPDAG